MKLVNDLKEKVFTGGTVTKEEALLLLDAPLEELTAAADEIRKHFNGNTFDMCTIINGKCGKCSEDCKYWCAERPLPHLLRGNLSAPLHGGIAGAGEVQ